VAGATTIYSDDGDVRAIAGEAKIKVIGIADLELPPQSAQLDLLANLQPSEENVGDTIDQDEASAESGSPG
jgi:hypothetical protein